MVESNHTQDNTTAKDIMPNRELPTFPPRPDVNNREDGEIVRHGLALGTPPRTGGRIPVLHTEHEAEPDSEGPSSGGFGAGEMINVP